MSPAWPPTPSSSDILESIALLNSKYLVSAPPVRNYNAGRVRAAFAQYPPRGLATDQADSETETCRNQ